MKENFMLFQLEDFSEFGRDAALVITDELNRALIENYEEVSSSNASISIYELKNDMQSAPHLYLSDSTIQELGLVQFSNQSENQ